MSKTLIIDIDCIAFVETPSAANEISFSFEAGVFRYLSRIALEMDYALILIKPEMPDPSFENSIVRFCAAEQIHFKERLTARDLSKSHPGLDGEGTKLICRPSYSTKEFSNVDTILLDENVTAVNSLKSWKEIYELLLSSPRTATVNRKTSETDINCFVNLDGTGQSSITTGLGFFDHMLQQIARHGNVDLSIDVKGDLHIDEHHTIEDVGLALGAAFSDALGNKKGIERYGFLLPMDDCLAQVAIDFGGRPWLVWDAKFTREKIGDMPTEMFYHFFKSFSDTAKCNLNIKAEGTNEHHKIESIFKAFAKSIHLAVTKNNNNIIPSTKGTL